MAVDLGDSIKVVFRCWHVPDEDIIDALEGAHGGRIPSRELKRMTNKDRPLVEMWDSRPYVLQPGETDFWPAELCFKAFGDPRSGQEVRTFRSPKGTVGFVPDRATEVRRIRLLYGNMAGGEDEVYGYPIVELYTLQDERITTVLEDPRALTTTAVVETRSERDQMVEMIRRQQAQIDQLMKVVGLNKAVQREIDDSATVTPIDDDGGDYNNANGAGGADSDGSNMDSESAAYLDSDPHGTLVEDESDVTTRQG